jgi:hypothetical protein
MRMRRRSRFSAAPASGAIYDNTRRIDRHLSA